MDEFGFDRPELSGSLVSMEFGTGGRIQQLWVADPAHTENEEFQFVAPPLSMGEEISDDYFPGTIQIAARTSPDDPWISSRNSSARRKDRFDEEDGPATEIVFEYEFPFLDELEVEGRFHEINHPVPHVAWDITIRNRSRRTVEIGELGFPMALNNVYEGFHRTDAGIREMYHDRVAIHKAINGAASYLFAQRLTARPPGLLIMPGAGPGWEFYHHVRASLVTPYRWEGVPVVYAHSRATIEREGWGDWFNGHSDLVLEPRDSRDYQILFIPAERDQFDRVSETIAALRRPAIRIYPSAVVPLEVGAGVEIHGSTPLRFETDVEAETETDADDEGGFCFVRAKEPGPLRLHFVDDQDRESTIHLLFIEPIVDLIGKRADWIFNHQVVTDKGPLHAAILPADNRFGEVVSDLETLESTFGIESGLADALFLAEKNAHQPNDAQIRALDQYIDKFLEGYVVNPGDGSVGSQIASLGAAAINFGRPMVYPLAFNLYAAMARVAAVYGHTQRSERDYLEQSLRVASAMFRFANPSSLSGVGIPLMTELPEILARAWRAGITDSVEQIGLLLNRRWDEFMMRRYPFASDTLWSTQGFAEVFEAAARKGNEELAERTMRLAFAARSLSPSWWWYGSDKRWIEDFVGHPAIADKGEMCHGPTNVADAAMAFRLLEHDSNRLPDPYLRAAFGGMLGVWSLVREDGAGSMGFTPDSASEQFGMATTTGDLGVSLFLYMRRSSAYVLPSRTQGLQTFGCHFEVENEGANEVYTVRPWDGVGRRIAVRQLGIEAAVAFGRIEELRFDGRKRRASLKIHNPADRAMAVEALIAGLWGRKFRFAGQEIEADNGELRISVEIPKRSSVMAEVEVI